MPYSGIIMIFASITLILLNFGMGVIYANYKEKIKDLGIGVYIIGVGIFCIILMISWLLYKIFNI